MASLRIRGAGGRPHLDEILELEHRTVDTAIVGRASGTAVADPAAVEAATAARPSLSDEQRAVVRRLALSGDAVDIVVGRPGSGKTFALGHHV